MTLKIIAGEYGSRVLRSVRGMGTRPMLGQVREAMFSILGDVVDGAHVWDLFAGTGANGIEALSRGAAHVTLVEKNNKAIQVLNENLEALGDEARAATRVMRGDAWQPPMLVPETYADGQLEESMDTDARGPFIETYSMAEGEVAPDLVFLDPPYAMVEEDPVRSVYRAGRIFDVLAPGGRMVFHFMAGHLEEDDFDASFHVELRTYGKSALAFLSAAD